ncbi:hypothetical protein CCACVL1_18447 [Corchorus capsularis]|uniref:Uncharacterized protein n=1 Tax=Corchorus capsularis TaxID=210143 RepID=A0A1R3HLE0_COCAP|nr:hypothetical protein CCACVL1_18447 [Corchorus capsularis]
MANKSHTMEVEKIHGVSTASDKSPTARFSGPYIEDVKTT